jgi:hypothetical protein
MNKISQIVATTSLKADFSKIDQKFVLNDRFSNGENAMLQQISAHLWLCTFYFVFILIELNYKAVSVHCMKDTPSLNSNIATL